jgi:hypothetical protein
MAHLLVWNPENYPELLDDFKKWLAGKLPKDSWSIGRSKSIEVGTRVFLMRVKVEPKGIIAMGEAMSEGFVRDHYSDPDKEENAAYVSWESFAHPDHPPLLLDDLLRIDGRKGFWTPPGSIPISEEGVTAKLEAAWARAVKREGVVQRLDDDESAAGKPDKPHLKLIRNVEELAENFRTFQRDARRYPSRRASILRATKYWLRDANSGAFGPGKFLGYRGMDFGVYEQARKDSTGDQFQGTLSREAIERVSGDNFVDERDLVAELHLWGAKMFGDGAFGGASTSKWRFLTFPIPGREVLTDFPDEISQPETFFEGATRTVSVNVYERDRKARTACIAHYGTVCSVCGLDFVKRYGKIGEGFIHVHHLKPLSEVGEGYRVHPIDDLRPVCPNCHGMIHRKTPCLTIKLLKAMLQG